MSEENDTPEEDFAAAEPESNDETIDNDPPKKSSGGLQFLTLLMLAAVVGLFVFPFVWGFTDKVKKIIPDSSVLNDWLLWLGDLHVMIVHIPIGIFVYVLLMEIFGLFSFGKFKPQLRGALFLNSIFGIIAVAFGYFYFLRGDYGNAPIEFDLNGNNMGMHMWLSILFTAFVILAFVSKMWAHHQKKWSPFYPLFIIVAAASVGVSAHKGGNLIHTDKDVIGDFTKLKNGESLGLAEEEIYIVPDVTGIPAGERLVYSEIVKPILYGKCWECHATADLNPLGVDKIKAQLEMTSVEKLLAGGKNQDDFPTLVPGDSEGSEMMVRPNLDTDDDEFMPKGSEDHPEKQLTDGEKRILAWWIDNNPIIDEAGDKPLSEVPGHEAIMADVEAFQPAPAPSAEEKEKAAKKAAEDKKKKEESKAEEKVEEPVEPAVEEEVPAVEEEAPAVDPIPLPLFEEEGAGMLNPDSNLGLKSSEATLVPPSEDELGESVAPEMEGAESKALPAEDAEATPQEEEVEPKPAAEEGMETEDSKPASEEMKEDAEPAPASSETEEEEPKPATEEKEETTPAPEKKQATDAEPEAAPAEEKEAEPAPATEEGEASEAMPETAPAEEKAAEPATEEQAEPATEEKAEPATEEKEAAEAMPETAPAEKKEAEPATEEKAEPAPATEEKEAPQTAPESAPMKEEPAPEEEKSEPAPAAPTPETLAPEKEEAQEGEAKEPAKVTEEKVTEPAPEAPEQKEIKEAPASAPEEAPAPAAEPEKTEEAPQEEEATEVMTPEERAREAIKKLREAATRGN